MGKEQDKDTNLCTERVVTTVLGITRKDGKPIKSINYMIPFKNLCRGHIRLDAKLGMTMGHDLVKFEDLIQ